MKFEISKKTLIIILSSVVGIILLWGIISMVGHRRYERNNFGRNFGAPGCGMSQENPDAILSGMKNIIATKDYSAFQSLFSGSKMLQQINTPAKFATRVELQNAMTTVQTLQATLWSGTNDDFGPLMFDNSCQQAGKQVWRWIMGRENGRWNMIRRR